MLPQQQILPTKQQASIALLSGLGCNALPAARGQHAGTMSLGRDSLLAGSPGCQSQAE